MRVSAERPPTVACFRPTASLSERGSHKRAQVTRAAQLTIERSAQLTVSLLCR